MNRNNSLIEMEFVHTNELDEIMIGPRFAVIFLFCLGLVVPEASDFEITLISLTRILHSFFEI